MRRYNHLLVAVTVVVACSFFLISTAPGAVSSSDSSKPGLDRGSHGSLEGLEKVKKWRREHTTTVQVKKIYTYSREKSALSVKTVYTGGRLKEIINSRSDSKTRSYRIKPSRLKEFQGKFGLGKKKFRRLLDQKPVKKDKGTKTITITTASDPPNWYKYYKYPQWTYVPTPQGNLIESDPINLAWQGKSWDDSVPLSKVVEEIEWEDPHLGNHQWVYDYYDDGWEKQGKQLANGEFDRDHVRLWSIVKPIWGGHTQIVVGSAHQEDIGHNVTSFEAGEDEVTEYFWSKSPEYNWTVSVDSYDLGTGDNVSVPHDGLATEIWED